MAKVPLSLFYLYKIHTNGTPDQYKACILQPHYVII